MKLNIRFFLVFLLKVIMRGIQAVVMGSAIFTFVVSLIFLFLLYPYSSPTITSWIPWIPIVFVVGVMFSVIPGILGGILLVGSLYRDSLKGALKSKKSLYKGLFIGSFTSIFVILPFEIFFFGGLKYPMHMDNNGILYILFPLITIIITSSVGGWAGMQLSKDISAQLNMENIE
jgi:hypothetical protein